MPHKLIDSVIIEESEPGIYMVQDVSSKKYIARVSKIVYPILEDFIEHFHSRDLAGVICAMQDGHDKNHNEYHLMVNKKCKQSKERRDDVAILIVKILDNDYHPRRDNLVKER